VFFKIVLGLFTAGSVPSSFVAALQTALRVSRYLSLFCACWQRARRVSGLALESTST
jgi:hypothetical protein